jgi:hypothetical protein
VRAVGGNKLGTIAEISIEEGWVDIKKRGDTVDLHPEALFAPDYIDTKVLAEALVRIGEYAAAHGLEAEGPYQAARDLLSRRAPRVGGQPLRHQDETGVAAALCPALALDGGVLPIQGPPGAGKTYTGARGVIDRYVARVIVRPDSIDIELREPTVAPVPPAGNQCSVTAGAAASSTCTTVISLPWSAPAFFSVKGVLHQPEAKPTLKQETRDAILLAITKARS